MTWRSVVEQWWKIAAGAPFLVVGSFLLGGVLALGYSYYPLHSSKIWKIDYLESRLESQRQQIVTLEEQVSTTALSEGEKATEAELQKARTELASASKEIKQLASEAKSAKKSVDRWKRSSDQWNARFNKIEKERDALLARVAPKPLNEAAPAAIAAGAESADPLASVPSSDSVAASSSRADLAEPSAPAEVAAPAPDADMAGAAATTALTAGH